MVEISAEARSRYKTISAYEYVAGTPAVAEGRFRAGHAILAETSARTILGFALICPLDGLLLLDNISTSSHASGRGIGRALLDAVLQQAAVDDYCAVALTTFRDPPWNGPWFRKFGFVSMPDTAIGPELRAIIGHQAAYLDPQTRETLWRSRATPP